MDSSLGDLDPCLFLSFGPDVMKSGRGCGICVCHSIFAEYPVQLCLTMRWVVVFELKVASCPPPLRRMPRSLALSLRLWAQGHLEGQRASGSPPASSRRSLQVYGRSLGSQPVQCSRSISSWRQQKMATTLHEFTQFVDPKTFPRVLQIQSGFYYQGKRKYLLWIHLLLAVEYQL